MLKALRQNHFMAAEAIRGLGAPDGSKVSVETNAAASKAEIMPVN